MTARRHGFALGVAVWAVAAVLTPPAGAEPVTTIQNNGDPANRIDIAILGDGYRASELATYAADVQNILSGVFAEEPFKEYRPYFNVHRIDVISNQSGADHPESGTAVDTALDATYNCAGIARLICVNQSKVNTILQNSLPPAMRDMVVVVVNDPAYGGSGGPTAVLSTNSAAVHLFLHETGHSLGLLADEYGGPPPPACDSAFEPIEANATKATSRATIKWAQWIDGATPIPTTGPTVGVPGLYEGAKYCDTGLFRPTDSSKMRTLEAPFEQINSEQLVRRFYAFVSPIDAAAPTATTLSAPRGAVQAFSVTALTPATHALGVTWLVDGQALASGPSFALDTATLTAGTHTVEARVVDPTAMVRSDPVGVLRDTRRWTLTVAADATLGVVRAGAGSGTVTSVPAGINCGTSCSSSYGTGVQVTLTATPARGSVFAGWSGAGCSGTGTCVVNAAGSTIVTATFTASSSTSFMLGVNLAGTGAGSVTSSPGGISCLGDCSEPYLSGSVVVLSATAAAGSVFTGWSGAGCSGTGTCAVTVNGVTTVTASFNPATVTLASVKEGTGSGTVTSSPGGIDCGGDCSQSYATGTRITLTATPAAGSIFTGWAGGGCAGTGPCVVILAADTTVTAGFAAGGSGQGAEVPVPRDYDGDRRAGLATWRRQDGLWAILRSSDGTVAAPSWGAGAVGDSPVPADYDGDGRADIAVWRPTDGTWYIVRSSDGGVIARQWGAGEVGDIPVPADYDGDGKADIAVWRPTDGTWYIIRSSDGGVIARQWGEATVGDVPVPGDYDGDGKADIAIWRPTDGTWYVIRSSDGGVIARQWGAGAAGDIPVPRDYDGDGRVDLAVWRPGNGRWYIIRSSDGDGIARDWGAATVGDVPVPADYDGDGKADIAVWRASDGTWYVIRSSDGGVIAQKWTAASLSGR